MITRQSIYTSGCPRDNRKRSPDLRSGQLGEVEETPLCPSGFAAASTNGRRLFKTKMVAEIGSGVNGSGGGYDRA